MNTKFAVWLVFAALNGALSGIPLGAQAQSKADLFGDDEESPVAEQKASSVEQAGTVKARGSVEIDTARMIRDPEHWSNLRLRSILDVSGGSGLKWKLGARLDADAAYAGRNESIYPSAVRNDQKLDVELRENYVDFSGAGMEFRLGKQYVVWGEMVGMFLADVVSPRDLRGPMQVELDNIRRTQWAARIERFSGDWHSEALWVPVQTYDKIGKPGADFYPYPALPTPGYAFVIADEKRPKRDISNSGFGLRTGFLKAGWDVSAFGYVSRDVTATFERNIVTSPVPATIYTPVHDRIRQFGATVAKDFSGMVFKTEAVYTKGRRFSVTRLDDADGLIKSDSLDLAMGLDFTPMTDARLNAQVFNRTLAKHDSSMVVSRSETGGSLYFTYALTPNLEGQLLWARSFNRDDGWVSPVVVWKFSQNTRLRVGADFYYGPTTGMFGRYDNQDRVFAEVRLSY